MRSEPLVDSFGRVVRDLRISITDRCNFRCRYCMPAEGLPWHAAEDVLTTDEIVRIGSIFRALGVHEMKLTGGEPTVRRELVDIVGGLRELDPVMDLSMTTNGQRLDVLAQPLSNAGLKRVTVSCDSLLRHRFAELTRRDALDAVLRGINAAAQAGLDPIKINCVVIAGTNDDEVLDFVDLARRTGYGVRFIEYMPLDADGLWSASNVVPSATLRDVIERRHPLLVSGTDGPAARFTFADGASGEIGFISSVTTPFCAACDRVRITADGQLRSCLFALDESDLRTPMRSGASDADLELVIRQAVWSKWAGHRIGQDDFVRPARSMSQIGG